MEKSNKIKNLKKRIERLKGRINQLKEDRKKWRQIANSTTMEEWKRRTRV